VGVRSFDDLRAWQSARKFKLAIYRLIEGGTLAKDFELRDQLRDCSASAVSHVAEGYGRFYPADFARFVGMAKASIIEAQNHLIDAVDRGHISEETRAQHHDLGQSALRDVTALIEYLQSPKAAENAKKARAKRQARRTQNSEPRTENQAHEPKNTNPEPGT
jgi:four helix bundle protein